MGIFVIFAVVTLNRLAQNRFQVPVSLLGDLSAYENVYGHITCLISPRRFEAVFDFAAYALQGDVYVFDLELVDEGSTDYEAGKVHIPSGAVTGTLIILGEDYAASTELFIDSLRLN